MKKLFLYLSIFGLGVTSCTQDLAVPEGELPEWLGASLYEELKNPKSLDGTFNTYLKLVDDCGYAEVLGKTGSKTLFPANDAAFEEFFKDGNNRFHKSSYDQLTQAEKAQLLYSSMLDNAILVGNLSTKDFGGNLSQGMVVKHPTNITLLQSVEPLFSHNMPKNNRYFNYWINKTKSINALYDDTKSPMVHLTGEYMLNNAMTVAGQDNDFYVLTGNEYVDGDAYVFNHRVVKGDVTCQNGYIHQIDGVLINPGNMAQIIRSNGSTQYMSRMLDYFAVPVAKDGAFNLQYQDYSREFGTQDSVFAIRYLSKNSQQATLNKPLKNEQAVSNDKLLDFDPGWNAYAATTAKTDDGLADIAAMLIPTDDVVENYFCKEAAYIVKNLGVKEYATSAADIKAHLNEHLDAIYNNDPTIFTSMLNNIMKPYLSKTVPSKFSTVQNDAFEFLNVKIDDIKRKADGKFDVQIANNGVIYHMNKFFGPELYRSVLGPASVYTNMRIMGKMLNDHQTEPGVPSTLGADMYYYLLSMKSKYALFVPTDNDDFYYIDPTSMDDADGIKALKFEKDSRSSMGIVVQRYIYEPSTQTFTIDPKVAPVAIEKGYYNTQIQDMLNYHTVVLSGTNGLNGNQYYLTKHGGAIYVPDGKGAKGATVKGGMQLGTTGAKASVVEETFDENSADAQITNGTVYRIDRPIMPTTKSVYTTINEQGCNDFVQFCLGFSENVDALLAANYISASDSKEQRADKMKKVAIFGEGNVMNMLSTYNYTMFVPQSMAEAHANGLPTWDDVNNLVVEWDAETDETLKAELQKQIRATMEKMRKFVLYHIQNNSVFDDVKVNIDQNQTFCVNDRGIAEKLSVRKEGNQFVVVDAASALRTPTVVTPNLFARDMTFTKESGKDVNGNDFDYNTITSSSFVVVHIIDTPLCYNANNKY